MAAPDCRWHKLEVKLNGEHLYSVEFTEDYWISHLEDGLSFTADIGSELKQKVTQYIDRLRKKDENNT